MSSVYNLVLVLFISQSALATNSALYTCQLGVYELLDNLTNDCRMSSYVTNLHKMRKGMDTISGMEIVEAMRSYCRVKDKVKTCVDEFIYILPCLKDQLEPYETMAAMSDSYCDGNNLKQSFAANFENLPMEELDFIHNQCYRMTPGVSYPCVRRYYSGNRPVPLKDRKKKILSSFRCTYRKMARQCSSERALLLTTLEYGYLIVPPALGINVSEAILRAVDAPV